MTGSMSTPSLWFAVESFNGILDIDGRPFGATSADHRGVSDGNQGVQWNIRWEKETETVELGVNLEGMKYDNWPIARFLENEMGSPQLPSLAATLNASDSISLAIYRDAWQAAIRPRIVEEFITGTPVRLMEVTPDKWILVLKAAYTCLDSERNQRGRAIETVTLRSGKKQAMEVTPHLHISTPVWTITPSSSEQARQQVTAGFDRLKPIYALVKRQSALSPSR